MECNELIKKEKKNIEKKEKIAIEKANKAIGIKVF